MCNFHFLVIVNYVLCMVIISLKMTSYENWVSVIKNYFSLEAVSPIMLSHISISRYIGLAINYYEHLSLKCTD